MDDKVLTSIDNKASVIVLNSNFTHPAEPQPASESEYSTEKGTAI